MLNWIRVSGTSPEQSRSENIAIQNMNLTAAWAIVTVAVYLPIDLYAGDLMLVTLHTATITCYIFTFFAIRYGGRGWAKTFGFFIAALTIHLNFDALGREALIQFFYLMALGITFFVFLQSEKKWLFVSVSMMIVGWIASFAAPDHFLLPSALHPEYYSNWAPILITPFFLTTITYHTYHMFHRLIDLAERQKNELVNSSRMAAVGEMAGGMAHEINTPLGIIVGAASNLRSDLRETPQDRVKKNIDIIEETAFRISKIIAGLLAFSRGERNRDDAKPKPLKAIVDMVVSFCTEKFKNNGVNLKINLAEGETALPQGTLLGQVILNLLNNAFDATRGMPNPWIEVRGETVNNEFVISVIDSGTGIPDEIVGKIMEPFFTTKPIGQGTGLGLSISKGLVEGLRGKLAYNLHEGHTCFTVTLPKATPAAAPAPATH